MGYDFTMQVLVILEYTRLEGDACFAGHFSNCTVEGQCNLNSFFSYKSFLWRALALMKVFFALYTKKMHFFCCFVPFLCTVVPIIRFDIMYSFKKIYIKQIYGWFHPGWKMTAIKWHFFYCKIQTSLNISIAGLQPTCRYQLRVSRGPDNFILGHALV